MRVAVVTLCRDRVGYTRRSFESLVENAGCRYDHVVVDQASGDDTWSYLLSVPLKRRIRLEHNIGICPALNLLLNDGLADGYDVVVRFDNDCIVRQPDTLRVVCELAAQNNLILAPRVIGLRNPPTPLASFAAGQAVEDGWRWWTILETSILGGVFMAMPAVLFTEGGFRYDETNPPWGGDERICDWHRARGGRCGYVDAFTVEHATDQHHVDYPDYFQRRVAEGGPA